MPDSARFVRGQRIDALDVETDHVQFEVTQHDPTTQSIRSAHVEMSEMGVHLYPVRLRYAFPSELDLMARLAGAAAHALRWMESRAVHRLEPVSCVSI